MIDADPHAPAALGMPSVWVNRGLVIDAFSEDLGDRAAKIFKGSKWWDHPAETVERWIWWILMDIEQLILDDLKDGIPLKEVRGFHQASQWDAPLQDGEKMNPEWS